MVPVTGAVGKSYSPYIAVIDKLFCVLTSSCLSHKEDNFSVSLSGFGATRKEGC